MEDMTVGEGFSEAERGHVAALYWEAFGRKLRPAFTDEPTGLAVVRAALRSDRLLVARQSGRVVGACGFYQAGVGAADLRWSPLRESLSTLAALRATLVLSVLARSDRPGALVLDGICVDHAARGRGTGTALLSAAADKARRTGASRVRLSVVDDNPRARALYERRGFTPTGRGTLGPLSSVYGFDGYTTMELEVRR
ncbi:GNAT family N-acetyltransferase [Sanguibacter sp. Leaf3]|uniref:GNAT family N-acetyltransferase n=1 Tax=Sanguibacter sp. Leaf3 TaxID=1736209 RepID=UPI0006FC490A|nr:GNAT family N-acetyltransferase [Sanguibacter sp. Leaf3]KQT98119.1 GCN5 family acetyltransferase [Sanguibacter sp. Leaf3]